MNCIFNNEPLKSSRVPFQNPNRQLANASNNLYFPSYTQDKMVS